MMDKPLVMSQEIKQIIDQYAYERIWYIQFLQEKKLIGEFQKFLQEKDKMYADIKSQMNGKF
jgi:hypothetical protein